MEVYSEGKRIVCETATAEEVLVHTLGSSEEAAAGKLLATTDGEIVGLCMQ